MTSFKTEIRTRLGKTTHQQEGEIQCSSVMDII